MKKKYIIPGLLAAVAAVGLTSCDEEKQSLLSDLEVTGYTQEFKVGDKFSKGGLKVEAKYADDKVVDVTNDVEIKAPESLSAPGTYAVIISYGGLSEAYQITVKDSSSSPATPVTLKNLIVSGAKDSFIVGEAFATTGLKVEAKYSDDKVVEVTNDAVIDAPENISAPGTYAVVVSYGGLSTSYQVTVSNEVFSVADAVNLGVANASKINGGVITQVLAEEKQPGTYTLNEEHQTYIFGENYLQVKNYSGYDERYNSIDHYFLASNDKVYGASEYYDRDLNKFVLSSMDTSGLSADVLNGVALYNAESEHVYGSAAYVNDLYAYASKNGNGDFKEIVVDDTYTFEAGMYEEESGYFYKLTVSFELSSEKTFKNIDVLITGWNDTADFEQDETTHFYSLTDKAAIHGAMYQQFIFDETIGARDYEAKYVAENLISKSFTLKDSKNAEVVDGATLDVELNEDTTLSYASTNKLLSMVVDKPQITFDFNKLNAYYSNPESDGDILGGFVDDSVEKQLTFNDYNGSQTVFTILENGDLKDAEGHVYVKQNKDNQSVYDLYIYTLEDGRYVKFNYSDDPYMDSTIAYSGDGKIHIRANYCGTHELKIETILAEVTITLNVPYKNPDSMSAKEFIPNEDNPNQATYASEESSSMKSLVNDSLYFIGVPKYQYMAENTSPSEFKAELISDNKADATLELVECSYQDGKIKAYQFTSAKTGTYEVKITSTVEGCEEISTVITIDVVDVSSVKITDLVNGYYEGFSNMLPSFYIDFKPTSSDNLKGVAYVGFETWDWENNKYATTYDYVIDAEAKTVTLTESDEKVTAPLTLNLNKFMEMSLNLQYNMGQYPISLSRTDVPDLSTYYADYKNVENEDTISISADGITATLGGQNYTTTSATMVGNYVFVDFETVSLVLDCASGSLTDSTYGRFNKVVHVDPLADYYGTYTYDQSTLIISADGIDYDGYSYQLKSFEGNTIVIIDDTNYECTLEITSEGLLDVTNGLPGILLVKEEVVDPLAPYYGTYIDTSGLSTLRISADGIDYDGYDYRLRSLDGNTMIIEDITDSTFFSTLEIRSEGLYDTNNGVLLIKQEVVDPLAAYYGNYEHVDQNDGSTFTITIDETGFHYYAGSSEKTGKLTFEAGIIIYVFEDSFYGTLELTPTMDGSICSKLTDGVMDWEYLRK